MKLIFISELLCQEHEEETSFNELLPRSVSDGNLVRLVTSCSNYISRPKLTNMGSGFCLSLVCLGLLGLLFCGSLYLLCPWVTSCTTKTTLLFLHVNNYCKSFVFQSSKWKILVTKYWSQEELWNMLKVNFNAFIWILIQKCLLSSLPPFTFWTFLYFVYFQWEQLLDQFHGSHSPGGRNFSGFIN